MKVIRSIEELQTTLWALKLQGKSIGFVPTMGYLHEGHASLMKRAKQENNLLVVSIFVNPKQFGPSEDLWKYPRDFERDSLLCQNQEVDFLFYPSVEEIYPPGFGTTLQAHSALSRTLCGRFRPGHFDGVVTVVAKLFNIVMPNRAYFGEKDFQQLVIIKRMVRDMNFPIEIVGMPTVREPDGLALSSRNSYLSPEERKAATILYKSLGLAQQWVNRGERDSSKILAKMEALVQREPMVKKIDYIQIVHPETLEDLPVIQTQARVTLAVWIGETRLIDNQKIEL